MKLVGCILMFVFINISASNSIVFAGDQLFCKYRQFSSNSGDWNGKSCAFTLSTDDGYIDNLVWRDVFKEFGVRYTIFITTSWIGHSGKLTASDLNNLYFDGFEIAAHSVTHKPLNPKEALKIQYNGSAEFCYMKIADDILYVDSPLGTKNFQISLTDENYDTLNELHIFLELNNFDVEMFNYTRPYSNFRYSKYLENFDWTEVKQLPFTLLSKAGTTDEECEYEILQSKIDLETIIEDDDYKCLTFAYPCHAYSERVIKYLKNAGYLAARDGTRPYSSSWGKVYPNLYTISLKGIIRNIVGPYNSFNEEEIRQKVRSLIETAKEQNMWINIYTHKLEGKNSCNEEHMRYIIDEINQDGDVWIDTFANVTKFIICEECNKYDFDHDDDIDGSDLAVFAQNLGKTDCSSVCAASNNGVDEVGSDIAVFATFFGTTNCLPTYPKRCDRSGVKALSNHR